MGSQSLALILRFIVAVVAVGSASPALPAQSVTGKVLIELPAGAELKLNRRKGNTSSRVELTVNRDTQVETVVAKPPAPPPKPAPPVQGALELREVVTTGSIAAGATALTVASGGFRAGDYVIVEIGREPGKGLRGTRGVGGVWPAKSYATFSQMQADSQPNGLFVWLEDTGDIYERINGAWQGVPYYYIAKAIPRSLQARVTAVNGNTLTLDRPAAVTVSGANVYLDNAPIINAATAFNYDFSAPAAPSGVHVRLPAGKFAIGGSIQIGRKSGWTFSGEGKDKTRLYSPKGVPSARLEARFSENTTLRDFTFQGNFGDNGFGLNWASPGSTIPNANDGGYVTESVFPRDSGFSRAIMFFGSRGGKAQDLRIIDAFQHATSAHTSDDVWGHRLESILNAPFRVYIQWQFQWVDSKGGGCVDCSVTSPHVVPGFEAFRSRDVSFIRPVGLNATFAMNSGGNFLIEDAKLTFKPGALTQTLFSVATPIVDVNDQMQAAHTSLGGLIKNIAIEQEGYVDGTNSLIGILVTRNNPNVKIEGGHYRAPDWKEGARMDGAQAILSQGPNTVVDGFTVYGQTRPGGYPNIWVENGTVRNSKAFSIHGSGGNNTVGVSE